MCLDETFLSLCGPVASENCEQVLSSGFSCLVIEPEVCCDSDPRVKRDTMSHSQWAGAIPHHCSPSTLHHHLPETSALVECKASLSAFKLCRKGGVTHSSIDLFISHFAAFQLTSEKSTTYVC